MEREEAIKVLKKELQIIDDPNVTMTASEWEEHDDHMKDALDMAIEALNREQKKYDAICSELVALKSNLNEPIEVAMAYEKSIAIVRKYARRRAEQ